MSLVIELLQEYNAYWDRMKNFIIVSVLLYSLCLGCGSIIRSVPDVNAVPAKDADISLRVIEKASSTIQPFCDRNGPENLENFTEGAKKMVKCVKDVFNFEDINERMSTGSTEDVKQLVAEICHDLPTAYSCVSEFSTIINSCLLSDEVEIKDSHLRATINTINYMCADNGTQIFELKDEQVFMCLYGTGPLIKECMEPIGEIKMARFEANMKSDIATRKLFLMSEEQCQEFQAVKQCLVPSLQTCSAKAATTLSDIINIYSAEFEICTNVNNINNL